MVAVGGISASADRYQPPPPPPPPPPPDEPPPPELLPELDGGRAAAMPLLTPPTRPEVAFASDDVPQSELPEYQRGP